MHKTIDISLNTDIFEENRKDAEENNALLRGHGIRSFDFMGSIGSGKTLLIERLVDRLKAKGKRPAAIAGDVAGNDDYVRFVKHGIPAANINTGKECHLTAHQVGHALTELPFKNIDTLFIENVGNLVCPVDFPLGADMRIVVISVTEGDDMVRKHPLIFALSDVIVINKTDLANAIEVDPKTLIDDAKRLGTRGKMQLTDAKHGSGIDELMKALGLD